MTAFRIAVGGIIHEATCFLPEPTPLEAFDRHRHQGGEVAGGLVTRESYANLKEQLLEPLRNALPVDGVLLDLHGAFAAQSLDDGDGDILQSVRGLIGAHCPLLAVHDLHCNVSRRMVEAADALIVQRTYPHTDMAERGLEAAALMARVLSDEIRPALVVTTSSLESVSSPVSSSSMPDTRPTRSW